MMMGVGAARPHSHSNCRLGFFLGFFMDYADFIAIIDGIDDPDNVGTPIARSHAIRSISSSNGEIYFVNPGQYSLEIDESEERIIFTRLNGAEKSYLDVASVEKVAMNDNFTATPDEPDVDLPSFTYTLSRN